MQSLEDHEYLVGVLGRDADAVVGHREPPQLPVAVGRHVNVRCAARAVELDRVADQVLPEHAHLGGVGDQGRQRVVGDGRPGLFDAEAQGGRGLLHDRFEVHAFVVVVDTAHPGEVEKVVDECLHTVGTVDRDADVLVRLGVELPSVAPLEKLREAGDLAQRLLQVVGSHVRELLQLRVGPLQVGGLRVEVSPSLFAEGELPDEASAHEVDLAAQAPQVRGARRGDGAVEVAAGDGARVCAEPLQGRGDAAAQGFEDQAREEGDDRSDRPEHPVAQPHRGHEIVSGPGPLREQPFLLGGQGRADLVEGCLALRRAFRGQRRGRARGSCGDRPGDPLLPGLRGVPHRTEVPEARGVGAQQFREPGTVALLVREALLVGAEEVRGAGQAVAADAGLLVQQGRLQAYRGGQRGRLHVHEVLAEGRRAPQHPRPRHPEQGQYGQRRGHPDPQPSPGRPRGKPPRLWRPRVAGHL